MDNPCIRFRVAHQPHRPGERTAMYPPRVAERYVADGIAEYEPETSQPAPQPETYDTRELRAKRK